MIYQSYGHLSIRVHSGTPSGAQTPTKFEEPVILCATRTFGGRYSHERGAARHLLALAGDGQPAAQGLPGLPDGVLGDRWAVIAVRGHSGQEVRFWGDAVAVEVLDHSLGPDPATVGGVALPNREAAQPIVAAHVVHDVAGLVAVAGPAVVGPAVVVRVQGCGVGEVVADSLTLPMIVDAAALGRGDRLPVGGQPVHDRGEPEPAHLAG